VHLAQFTGHAGRANGGTCCTATPHSFFRIFRNLDRHRSSGLRRRLRKPSKIAPFHGSPKFPPRPLPTTELHPVLTHLTRNALAPKAPLVRRNNNYSLEEKRELGYRVAQARASGMTIESFMTAEAAAGRPLQVSDTRLYEWSIEFGPPLEQKPVPARFWLCVVYVVLGFLRFVVNAPVRDRKTGIKRTHNYATAKTAANLKRAEWPNQVSYNYLQVYRLLKNTPSLINNLPRAVYENICDKLTKYRDYPPKHPQVLYAIDATRIKIRATDGFTIGDYYWLTVVIDVHSRLIVGWIVTLGCPDSFSTTLAVFRAFQTKSELTMVSHGRCWILQHDHHPQFAGILDEYLFRQRVFHRHTTRGKPTTNPHMERSIGVIKHFHIDSELLAELIRSFMPKSWSPKETVLPPDMVSQSINPVIIKYNIHQHRGINDRVIVKYNSDLRHSLPHPLPSANANECLDFTVTFTGKVWVENYRNFQNLRNALGGCLNEDVAARYRANGTVETVEFRLSGVCLAKYMRDYLHPNLDPEKSSWIAVRT